IGMDAGAEEDVADHDGAGDGREREQRGGSAAQGRRRGLRIALQGQQPAGPMPVAGLDPADLVLADGQQRGVGGLEQRATAESGARRQKLEHWPSIVAPRPGRANRSFLPAGQAGLNPRAAGITVRASGGSRMKARVVVTLKKSVLDPQGQAVGRALGSLGFGEVKDVRLGKIIELDLDSRDPAEAKKRVQDMCEKLLANTVIEEYRVEEI